MKKYLCILISLSVVSFISCTKEKEVNNGESTDIQELTKPLDEALSDMYAFWSMAYNADNTKSALAPCVDNVSVCKHVETKENGDANDVSVYLVNFTNKAGFAVLNGKYSGPSVLAFIEEGAIDADMMDSVLSTIPETRQSDSLTDPAVFNDSENYIYYLLADIILSSSSSQNEVHTTKTVSPGEYLEIVDHVGPLVNCKWAQQYPFNKSMPLLQNAPYTQDLRQRAPVGCVMIAAAQMMMKTNHPAFSQFSGSSYSWSDFSSICNIYNFYKFKYSSYDNYATDDVITKMNALSYGLYLLGVPFIPSYGPQLTSVYTSMIIPGLQYLDPTYYANASEDLLNWCIWDITDMLDNDKPTIAYGQASVGNVGHAWLVDGYIRYVGTDNVTRTCLHFNWGQMRVNDGYFSITATYSSDDRFAYEIGYDQFIVTPGYNSPYTTVHYVDY